MNHIMMRSVHMESMQWTNTASIYFVRYIKEIQMHHTYPYFSYLNQREVFTQKQRRKAYEAMYNKTNKSHTVLTTTTYTLISHFDQTQYLQSLSWKSVFYRSLLSKTGKVHIVSWRRTWRCCADVTYSEGVSPLQCDWMPPLRWHRGCCPDLIKKRYRPAFCQTCSLKHHANTVPTFAKNSDRTPCCCEIVWNGYTDKGNNWGFLKY